MADYGELNESWAQFRQIVAGTRKKLLKKPNLPLAISQLSRLSVQMQDEEVPQHAAMCHAEMAALQQKLKNPNEERKQYLCAAKLLLQAYREYKKSGSRVYCPYPSDIGNYYMKAVKLAMEQKTLKLAGLTSLEAGKVMKECEIHPMSVDFLIRASRLLEGEFYSHTDSMYLLIEVYFLSDEWESMLSAIDDLWITLMKTRSKSSLGKKLLRDCEVLTLLTLTKVEMTASGRHKVLLEMYGQLPSAFDKSPSRVCVKESSSLAQSDFHHFRRLLFLVNDGLVDDWESLSLSRDCNYMSELAKRVCSKVIRR